MGLTQVSTDGVKNDAITKTKIPANQIEASELADNAVDTNAIADQAVALSKLPHGDGSSDGKFLRANNGADPSFETVSIPAGTTINNNANNKVITGSDTANTLEGESYVHVNSTSLSVGTQSPAYLANLHIRSSYASFRIDSDGANQDTHVKMQTGTGKNNYIYFGDAADDDVGQIAYDHNGDHMKFIVGTSEKIRINSNGIQFGGSNGASHGLDDYEEGTWTPQMHDGTISVANANYTKIGRQVTIVAQIYNFSDSTTNDALRIKNLPFGASVSGVACGSVMYSYANQQINTVLYIDSTHNGSLNLYGAHNTSFDVLRHNNLNKNGGNTDMYIFASYMTNA